MNPSAEMQALIAALVPIETPARIDWWPPAWGWWAVAMVLIAALALAQRLWAARRVRRAWRSPVLLRLADIERRAAVCTGPESQALLCELSVLLRQVALLHRPRAEVAGLSGDAWLSLLDTLSGTNQFSTGPARCLMDAPYRKVPVDRPRLQATVALSRRLLKRVGDPPVGPHRVGLKGAQGV